LVSDSQSLIDTLLADINNIDAMSFPSEPRSLSPTIPPKVLDEDDNHFGLFRLDPADGAGIDGPYHLDIVALHGIKGNAFRTWTVEEYMWLRDSLPKTLPGARIFSFGYDAQVALSFGTGGIDEFSRSLLEDLKRERRAEKVKKRRIIFICHSMGGIVVKKVTLNTIRLFVPHL
jgi:hypothetical protein